MTPGSHARPAEHGEPGDHGDHDGALEPAEPAGAAAARRRRRAWRLGTPLVVLLCGSLFVISAHNSHGTDLRPGRYTDLASLVSSDAHQYDALRQRVTELNADISILTNSLGDRKVQRYQREIEALKDPAGLVPHSGPGVTVTLEDAPEEVLNSTDLDQNLLLVHQQDIQAVVNAMWKGGATAVTIQGQRVVSTTGIKCVGNAVQLQGVPYSQPYVISAVGDPTALVSAIDSDDYLSYYRRDSLDPRIQVGWDLRSEASITAPAYDGLLDLSYATPLKE